MSVGVSRMTGGEQRVVMPETNEETWRLGSRDVRVTSLDTLYWPEARLTKGDLLAYYRDIAPVMLPSCVDRPVTLRVFPDGIHGEGFYRRDLPDHAPDWLRRTDYAVQSAERTIQLPLIDDAASLIWLANEGSIEFHLWSSRAADLEEPDQAVFDLDPGDEASFADVLQTALRLRGDLERHGLRGYPKTSGRSGLHVHLPLTPGYRFEEVRSWVKTVAERLAEFHPELIEVASGATHEGRRVAIDYAQNSIARTMAAPYGVRAVPAASVAAPLTWDEVAAGDLRPADLNLRTMLERIRAVGDLFAPLWTNRQRLPE